jgi:hypothetical protein
MIFKKILINDKNELLEYKDKIFQLFKDCFKKSIDENLWNWAYIENPNGSPVVSLYFDGNILAGHYAVIPIKLLNAKDGNVKAILSMTTMVRFSYRKFGIFIEQANEVYEKSQKNGYKLVIGFPNKQSAPGFKKRLHWTIESNLYVAKLSKDELMNIRISNKPNTIMFDTLDEKNLKWRLSKPNQEYIRKDNNILKKFGNKYDVIFRGRIIENFDEEKEYNVLICENFDKFLDKKQFDYIFGYKVFDDSIGDIDFKKDLIMSDIF